MKSKEELNALKKEVEAMNKKLAELTEEELEQVFGGVVLVDKRFKVPLYKDPDSDDSPIQWSEFNVDKGSDVTY